MEFRTCHQCGDEKPAWAFDRREDGVYHSWCRSCVEGYEQETQRNAARSERVERRERALAQRRRRSAEARQFNLDWWRAWYRLTRGPKR